MQPITARDGRLWRGSEPFRFIGTNCYFLLEEGAREVLGWTGYAGRVDEALRKAAGLGLGTVRAWAFCDDPDNPAAVLRAPGEYGEAGLAGVDLALEAAHRHGVRLILSLVNHWPDYGGAPRWLAWHGCDPAEPTRFYTEPAVVDAYVGHVSTVLEHRNPRTGLRWGEDPAVLGWELANEPRGTGLPGTAPMRAWVERLAGVVREHAVQPVLTGEEGFGDDLDAEVWGAVGARWMAEDTGAAWAEHSAIVDVASVHLYPEHWGWHPDQWEEAGVRWILIHADEAARLGRPLVVGELGLANTGLPLAERRRIYARWVEAAMAHPAVAGVCTWSLSTDDRPDAWDPFSWTWRDGTEPADPVNRYAALHAAWAATWGTP